MVARGVGELPATAMERAANIASRFANDKYLSMVLPPQAQMAIKTVKLLSGFLRRRKRRQAQQLVRERGPGTKQLARELGLL